MNESQKLELKPELGSALAHSGVVLAILLTIGLISIFLGKVGLVASLFIFGGIAIFVFLQVKTVLATHYKFYKNHLEFYEGFLARTQRIIPYQKITDTIYSQSIFDRLFNTGTFQFMTAGNIASPGLIGPWNKYRYAGIVMPYIPDPEENFRKIRKLIGH